MFFSNYTHELMKRFNEQTIVDEGEYNEDILNNWSDDDLQINFDDACDAKDSGLFSADEFKDLVRAYRAKGGKGNPMRYVFSCIEKCEDNYEDIFGEFDDCWQSPMERAGYIQRDFI